MLAVLCEAAAASCQPPAVLAAELKTCAQAFGVQQSAIEAAITGPVNGFIAQGNITALTANQTFPPLLATQVTEQTC